MKMINDFITMKTNKEKISVVTAYDYSSAELTEKANIDIILVGDTLGMVVLGYEDTLKVTTDDIVYHCKAVRRGAPNTFVIADMPFMSYHINLEETKKNAARLIIEGRANAVKLEGGTSNRLDAIKAIVDCEIPVVAHVGLTPQSIHKFGGFKVQGKNEKSYEEILKQAEDTEKAGAKMIVLEGIPEALGKAITDSLKIPAIGIGAGRYTDGQVLVYHDMLGLSGMQPKFVKQYTNISDSIASSLANYNDEVKKGYFPEKKHVYFPID